jgi:hydroxyacylglutathione hydrolase
MELITSQKLLQNSERFLSGLALAEEVRRGAILLDIRQPHQFASGHLAGSLNIAFYPAGYAQQVTSFAPAGRPLVLVCESAIERLAAAYSLLQAGFNLIGYTELTPAANLETLPQLTIQQLWQKISQGRLSYNLGLVDVRSLAEWKEYHIEGSIHIPYLEVSNRWQELDRAIELTVIAAKRYHSLTVISFLKQQGFDRINEVPAGMSGWARSGLPIRRGNF